MKFPTVAMAAFRGAPPSSGDETCPALARRASFIAPSAAEIAVASLPTGISRDPLAAIDGTPGSCAAPLAMLRRREPGDSFGNSIDAVMQAPHVTRR